MSQCLQEFEAAGSISLGEHIKCSPLSMQIETGLFYDSWVRLGRNIVGMREGSHFWIGDWLLYGSDHYSERFSQGAAEINLKPRTLIQYVYVARKYEPTQRIPGLSWRHHQIVAGENDLNVRQELLSAAQQRQLSTRELSILYREYRANLQGDRLLSGNYCECPYCHNVYPKSELLEASSQMD